MKITCENAFTIWFALNGPVMAFFAIKGAMTNEAYKMEVERSPKPRKGWVDMWFPARVDETPELKEKRDAMTKGFVPLVISFAVFMVGAIIFAAFGCMK